MDISTTEKMPERGESRADLDQGKTMEELMLENQQLRQAPDNLSWRLHKWEVNARDSCTMLDRSLMLYRNKSGTEGGALRTWEMIELQIGRGNCRWRFGV